MSRKPADKICGAKTRTGTICKQPAGFGTHHFGTGRCKYHGGSSGQSEAGRYLVSSISPRLRPLVETLLDDTKILDCRRELAMLRAELQMLDIDDFENITHYYSTLARLAGSITSTARTINEIERGKQHYLHISVTGTIVSAFADLGKKYITDDAVRAEFEKEMVGSIRKSIRASSARAIAAENLIPSTVDGEYTVLEEE